MRTKDPKKLSWYKKARRKNPSVKDAELLAQWKAKNPKA